MGQEQEPLHQVKIVVDTNMVFSALLNAHTLAGISMKIAVIIVLLMLCTLACNPRNKEFNAFDDEFRFHQGFRIEDYDTVVDECGYWNLTNRKDGSYYQFYTDEPDIVAKGFSIYLDCAEVDTSKELSNDDFQKLLDSYPIDLSKLKKELSKLNVVDLKYVREFAEVSDLNGRVTMDSVNSLGLVYKNDSIYFPSIDSYVQGKRVGRRIGYFNGKLY